MPPSADTWTGDSLRLVTMAMNFRQKGGDIAADAFRRLKPRYPDLTWHIIGGAPERSRGMEHGVTLEGVLAPHDPRDCERLRSILSSAFLLLHPTREDTSPLVITEAAYFGCPSISMNAFAIPELILDGETGILLERGADGAALAAAIESLLVERGLYARMRVRAREHALAAFRWDSTGQIIGDVIENILAG
jgi:glycosyltransferase involved in cell wall biosynthesis